MSRGSRFLKLLAKLVCKIQQQITSKLGILADFIRRSLQPCWRTFANWSQSKVENAVEVSVGVSCTNLTRLNILLWPIIRAIRYFWITANMLLSEEPTNTENGSYNQLQKCWVTPTKKKRPLLQITATIMKKVLKYYWGGTHKQRWTCVSRMISQLPHCVGLGKKELPA